MNDLQQGLAQRLSELRESFDRTFALPPSQPIESREGFLIIRAGTERYAIRLDAICGMENHRKIVSLPLQVPGLMGLAGLRGRLTPVFSLASLLGAGPETSSPMWLALCKGQAPIALAFDHFEGSAQISGQDVHAADPTEGTSPLTRQAVRLDSGIVYVIDVPCAVAAACKRLEQR